MQRYVIGFLVLVLAIFGLVFGLKNDKTCEPKHVLKIGLNPWIGNGLYFVAHEKGFFEKEGIKVELTNFDDGAVGKQLFNTGKIDALPITPETAVVIKDSGTEIKIVGMTVTSKGADGIIASDEIKQISDLKGKKVAFEVGSPSHFLLSFFLDQQNFDTSSLNVVNTTAPDAGAAFVASQVDAAVTWEPWLSKATDRKGGHVLASSKSLELFPDLMIFRKEVVDNQPDDIRALLRSLFAAIEWIKNNENEAAQIIGENFQIEPEEVKAQLATIQWLTYEDNLASFEAGQPQGLLQKASDLWIKLDLVQNPIDANDLVDDSILRSLYQ